MLIFILRRVDKIEHKKLGSLNDTLIIIFCKFKLKKDACYLIAFAFNVWYCCKALGSFGIGIAEFYRKKEEKEKMAELGPAVDLGSGKSTVEVNLNY